jgi:hypothetical protein
MTLVTDNPWDSEDYRKRWAWHQRHNASHNGVVPLMLDASGRCVDCVRLYNDRKAGRLRNEIPIVEDDDLLRVYR